MSQLHPCAGYDGDWRPGGPLDCYHCKAPRARCPVCRDPRAASVCDGCIRSGFTALSRLMLWARLEALAQYQYRRYRNMAIGEWRAIRLMLAVEDGALLLEYPGDTP